MERQAAFNSVGSVASSETQGQLVGTGKSLKRAKKNAGEEKSFFARIFCSPVLDFSPSPLTAPGSPRMGLSHFATLRVGALIHTAFSSCAHVPIVMHKSKLSGATSLV